MRRIEFETVANLARFYFLALGHLALQAFQLYGHSPCGAYQGALGFAQFGLAAEIASHRLANVSESATPCGSTIGLDE